ncbi:unnamed protein product [Ixodes pacificus]
MGYEKLDGAKQMPVKLAPANQKKTSAKCSVFIGRPLDWQVMQWAMTPCRRARENINVFPIATLNLEITNKAPKRAKPRHSENTFSVGCPKSRQNSPLICLQRSRRCAAKRDTLPR